MSRPVLFLPLAALALTLAAPNPLRAQAWGYQPKPYDYAAAWNFNRAYHHFLSSPYAVRRYSTTTPGYAMNYYSPFVYQGSYTGPGYVNQQITPYGFQAYYGMPATGSYQVTPYGGNFAYTPSYGYTYFAPNYNYSNAVPNYGYYP
jgi:hypothetical protein